MIAISSYKIMKLTKKIKNPKIKRRKHLKWGVKHKMYYLASKSQK